MSESVTNLAELLGPASGRGGGRESGLERLCDQVEINRLLKTRRLSQMRAATLLGVSQPKISALKHYKLEGFSVERLMVFLTALGRDVEIRIKAHGATHAPGRILVAAT